MSEFNDNRGVSGNDSPWGWIIGIVLLVAAIVVGVYALGNHGTSSASNNYGATSTRNDTTGSASGTGNNFSSQTSGAASPATGSSTR